MPDALLSTGAAPPALAAPPVVVVAAPLDSCAAPDSAAVLSDMLGVGDAVAAAPACDAVAMPPSVPAVPVDVAPGEETVVVAAGPVPPPTGAVPARTRRVRIEEVANVRYVAAEEVGYSKPDALLRHEPCPVTAAAAATEEQERREAVAAGPYIPI